MLNRYKLMREIESLSDKLFVDFSEERNIAQKVWERISSDATFKYKVRSISTPWTIPSWQGNLGDVFEVEKKIDDYIALSVDGSQIYPDKHQGTSCNLINIGSVQINYGSIGPDVSLDSVPYIFTGYEDENLCESPAELVNCRRQELELIAGYDLVRSALSKDAPTVFLFDGSLIFWHLEAKEAEVKQKFLSSYLNSLQQFYESNLLIAGYISMPKSKEILNLIRVALCDFVIDDNQNHKLVDHLVDSQIARFYLKPFTRTTIFKNYSKITEYYPKHIHPHFFYMHVGNEIARIEVPEWIASNPESVQLVSNIIANQAIKGRGYPVVLAEAHEQAVVKGPDRDFFYHLINKIGIENKRVKTISQKSRKKLGIGV